MGWVQDIFGSRSKKNQEQIVPSKAPSFYFPPPTADAPPVPQGTWSIIVDKNGDRVTDRPARNDDMLARHPVEYIYGGTFPKVAHPKLGRAGSDYNYNKEKDYREYLDYLVHDKRNREFLDKAVFLLSQTDDGRRLLLKSQKLGFQIVFDDSLCMEHGALGMCDYANKKIPLAQGRSPAEVALTLKHELQHMEDMDNGLGYSSADIPKNGIFGNRALESNARVSEAVAAAEILLGSPHGPPQQFRTPALLNNMWQRNPEIAQVAYAAMDDAKAGKWESYAAKVFAAYFKPTWTMEYYDKKYADYIASAVPDVSLVYGPFRSRSEEFTQAGRYAQFESGVKGLFYDESRTPEVTVSKLTIGNEPYGHALMETGFSLQGEKNYAQTSAGLSVLSALKNRIDKLMPENEKTAMLELPIMAEKTKAPAPSPYAWHKTTIEEQVFEPVQKPYRLDTENGRDYGFYTRYFADKLKPHPHNPRAIEYDIDDFLNSTHSTSFRLLIKAGLRCPIAAIPQQSLIEMCRYLQAENPPEEYLVLLEHWQEMKDRGYDPVLNNHEVTQEWFYSDKPAPWEVAHVPKMIAFLPDTPPKRDPMYVPERHSSSAPPAV